MMNTTFSKMSFAQALLIAAMLLAGASVHGFVTAPSSSSSSSITAFVAQNMPLVTTSSASFSLSMSQVPLDESEGMGDTERLLLQAKRERDLGLKQEIGKTIKGDGLDGLRAVVWQLFFASNVVFSVGAVALGCGLLLNMMGYGYYFDSHSSSFLVIDTIEHIRQDQQMAMQAAQWASEKAAGN